MKNKNKIKYIKKILDNDGNDYWDDCDVMCGQIQDIVNYENLQDWAKEKINNELNIKGE
tara:strand:- start:73 stop:249 length:177 start_codon:yes stop_codon:yes gene_type:complete